MSQNLDFCFLADSFPIFFSLLLLSFFSPFLFYSVYLLPFIPFLSTGKVLASALKKTWKWNIHQLGDLVYFTTKFAPKIGHVFFWYSSARIWSIFKMDTRMLLRWLLIKTIWCRQKMMTSQVVQCLSTNTRVALYVFTSFFLYSSFFLSSMKLFVVRNNLT